MMEKELINKNIGHATKWNVVSEIIAKLIAPITTIILARLLAPDVFGIVASITAITSLADLLTDAGFNAYIVQHIFGSKKEEETTVNVCFWSNFLISIILYVVIFACRYKFAELVDASGYENELIVAALVIPLTSISSISMAVMQKRFNFKALGIIKIICKVMPLIITIPLALLSFGCWSLIIGTLVGEVSNFILCLVFGKFLPKPKYSFSVLRKIFKFSSWAYLESILEWFLKNGVILFLGGIYGTYYLGLFKNGTTIILQVITTVYALYGNVYKAAVSKYQLNNEEFRKTFLVFQKYTTIFSIPLGIGVFFFRDYITLVLLGNDYIEASMLIGLWGLCGSLSIAFGNFYSDGIRAKGHPFILVIIDFIYLVAIGILLVFAPNITFEKFCIIYCLLKIIQPVLQIIFGLFICKVSLKDVFSNTYAQCFSSLVMAVPISLFCLNEKSIIIQTFSIVLCIIIYFASLIIIMPDGIRLLSNAKKIFKRE